MANNAHVEVLPDRCVEVGHHDLGRLFADRLDDRLTVNGELNSNQQRERAALPTQIVRADLAALPVPLTLATELRPEDAVDKALSALRLDNWPAIKYELTDYIERLVEAAIETEKHRERW